MEAMRSEYRLQEASTCSRSTAVYSKDRTTGREEAVHPCDDRRWCRHRVYQWGVYVCSDEVQVVKRVHVRCDENVVGCGVQNILIRCRSQTCRTCSCQHRDSIPASRCKFSTKLARSDRLRHDRLYSMEISCLRRSIAAMYFR